MHIHLPSFERGSIPSHIHTTTTTGLLSVPVFKALTGLPPYLGMLSALGVMWVLTDTIHAGMCILHALFLSRLHPARANKPDRWTLTPLPPPPPITGEQSELKVPAALSKIDVSGILFFFGILLSVGALDSAGILQVRGVGV